MAKEVKSLTGPQKDAFLRRALAAESGISPPAAQRLAKKLERDLTRVWVRSGALDEAVPPEHAAAETATEDSPSLVHPEAATTAGERHAAGNTDSAESPTGHESSRSPRLAIGSAKASAKASARVPKSSSPHHELQSATLARRGARSGETPQGLAANVRPGLLTTLDPFAEGKRERATRLGTGVYRQSRSVASGREAVETSIAPGVRSPVAAKTEPFDPYSPNVIVVLRKSGREQVLEALAAIGEAEQLRLLAREQQLGIAQDLVTLDEIRLAILAAAERRIANRRAAGR